MCFAFEVGGSDESTSGPAVGTLISPQPSFTPTDGSGVRPGGIPQPAERAPSPRCAPEIVVCPHRACPNDNDAPLAVGVRTIRVFPGTPIVAGESQSWPPAVAVRDDRACVIPTQTSLLADHDSFAGPSKCRVRCSTNPRIAHRPRNPKADRNREGFSRFRGWRTVHAPLTVNPRYPSLGSTRGRRHDADSRPRSLCSECDAARPDMCRAARIGNPGVGIT